VAPDNSASTLAVSSEALLQHWQGHRRLTRRFIQAFPENEFFQYSIGGMRPFADLVMEFVGMGAPTLKGLATGTWDYEAAAKPRTRAEALRIWDEKTDEINQLWRDVPATAFEQSHLAFGQWEGKGHDLLLYVIDNEIHHRAQASVYLRSLGIEPPSFPDRS
jgi:uncharacterized damage-inducible protein DinB